MPEGASYGQEAKRKLVKNLVRTALDLQRVLMYSGIGVLMKRGRFSIGKLPDMRERGFEAFPCCLVRAAVLTQGHDSRTKVCLKVYCPGAR